MLLFTINSLDNEEDKLLIENIYNDYLAWIKFRAYKIVNNIDVCDDLAQDCMFNMITHVDKLKTLTPDKQRAYIAVSIDNLAKNYNRKANRIITMNDECSADLDFIPSDSTIDDELDKKCDYATLKAGLDKLCDRDRDILMMRYDLELNDQEIADVLQIKTDCVRMTVLRSVRKLRREIDKLEGNQ